ncbi:e3 ubiquitin-protein ligase RNF126 [Nephila pilipes]|uniref:RING-type E3 ubiquitin transferase n=1 Tax=Nephila pilipes TaxID=299642 RepID=A0A8X6NBG6_NEPPI|nr:e3 ubiquitin-protein ligase RNF126 [Nephila pilipes]
MAEGIQLAAFNSKYFCHHCSREVLPFHTAELICPDCSSGFLEEVSKDLYEAENFSPDYEDESEFDEAANLSFIPETMDNLISRMLMNVAEASEAPERPEPHVEEGRLYRSDSLSDIIRHVSMREMMRAHDDAELVSFRYFDDYNVDEEVDALASQLLDEVEIVGPPPLPKEQIKAMPTVIINTEFLEKGVQCTVCMDDFSLREKAKKLPCNHLYHEKCITPWLERQATCPNCRDVIQRKNKRSRSCPRSRLNSRSSDSRRFSDASPLSEFFSTSMNPFRFLN